MPTRRASQPSSDDALRAELADARREIARLNGELRKVVAANARLTRRIDELLTAIKGQREDLEAARARAADAPSTPSGQVPPYLKPERKRAKKRPGRKKGHPGSRRADPEEVDRTETHRLEACPHCDGKVRALCGADGAPTCRYRYVEDVVVAAPEYVEHAVLQYWCGSCRRRVEPAVTAALPGARFGLGVVVRTAVQHYLMGITISKVVALLRTEHGFEATPGGLAAAWRQLSLFLAPDYAEFRAAALAGGVLHADETGWRVDGARHWLWVFCTQREALYVVDRSRGGEVARTVLGDGFDGTLVRDFYAAYARCSVKGTQFCLAHLLREFQKVEVRRGGDVGEEFARFRRLATAVFREALRWSKDRPPDPAAGEAARERFERRLLRLAEEPHEDPDVVRLADRCLRSALGLFTFLTSPGVPPTNNWAELNLRPAVIARKNSYGNRSAQGADTQGVLMTVLRSLQLRKEDVVEATIARVQKNLVENHRLKYTPPLGRTSDG